MYPLEKYKYFVRHDKSTGNPVAVVAVSSYAGRTVRGVAKCAPDDTFDLELGKRIAALRCAEKIAQKRLNRAYDRMNEAVDIWEQACDYRDAMCDYYEDAQEEAYEIAETLGRLLDQA